MSSSKNLEFKKTGFLNKSNRFVWNKEFDILFTNNLASCSDSFVFNDASICSALRILSLLLGYNFSPKNFETWLSSYFSILPFIARKYWYIYRMKKLIIEIIKNITILLLMAGVK